MYRMKIWMAVLAALLFVNCQSEGNTGGEEQANGTGAAKGTVAAALAGGTEEVRFTTADDIVITGTLYPAGDAAPAVLCLHQWRSDRGSFAALATTLQKEGMTVLAIDMRGYGGSIKTTAGKIIRPDRRAVEDIRAAMAFLRAHPKVDPARIALIGASYGSSNAIIYAADDPAVRAVVLLSPGLNYFNELPTEKPMRRYSGRPLLVAASSEDLRSVETVDAYRAIDPGMAVQLYANAGHGTDILAAGVGLSEAVVRFLKKNL